MTLKIPEHTRLMKDRKEVLLQVNLTFYKLAPFMESDGKNFAKDLDELLKSYHIKTFKGVEK